MKRQYRKFTTHATVDRLCGCTGTTVNIYNWLSSFTRTHLLLVGNDTVPISTWRGGGMALYRVPSSCYMRTKMCVVVVLRAALSVSSEIEK